MIKAIQKNSGVLAIFALLSTGVVAITHTLTADRILEQQQKNLLKVLNEVLPKEIHDNKLVEHCTLFTSKQYLGSDKPQPAYIATKNGSITGIAIQAIAPDGYNGQIKLMVGMDQTGTITGTRILQHAETPGLGDKIDLKVSSWIESFTGKRLEQQNDKSNSEASTSGWSMKQWAVRKDGGEFDQFTGATITPRAVVKAVKNASLFFQATHEELDQLPINCGGSNG
ncbi:electron transport complex subunit RsxG [Vibrio tapetis subsp. quintayensis]|uniref:electron transport complex subunit RsxG n=1 Tax=Vibrio tapetis TaxID=52443 RepID=UPI0025B5D448|nr:electron transport complex subunit RsxG [Vibrio tapetis]MDN3680489.1 electron transport complex subunit RsxG [Vibrio tapetis subsp. quintayensis]